MKVQAHDNNEYLVQQQRAEYRTISKAKTHSKNGKDSSHFTESHQQNTKIPSQASIKSVLIFIMIATVQKQNIAELVWTFFTDPQQSCTCGANLTQNIVCCVFRLQWIICRLSHIIHVGQVQGHLANTPSRFVSEDNLYGSKTKFRSCGGRC